LTAPGRLVLELVVSGPAQQQGSVKTFVPTRGGEPLRRAGGSVVVNVTTDNAALSKWRKRVAEAARAMLAGDERYPMVGVGFRVQEVAYFRRPDGHYGTGRNAASLKPGASARPIVRSSNAESAPDVDKLLRACFDALSGVVWKDDAQVTDVVGRKRFAVPTADGDGVRAVILVWLNDVQTAMDLPDGERVRFVGGQAALL
jgi:Endodeoxyribonuclease RusA